MPVQRCSHALSMRGRQRLMAVNFVKDVSCKQAGFRLQQIIMCSVLHHRGELSQEQGGCLVSPAGAGGGSAVTHLPCWPAAPPGCPGQLPAGCEPAQVLDWASREAAL